MDYLESQGRKGKWVIKGHRESLEVKEREEKREIEVRK
jgi:hypothetical protein